MDQNQKNFLERKKEVEFFLAKALFDEFQKGNISYEELRQIARYILIQMDKVSTIDEITKFTEELSKKWFFFKEVFKLEKAKQTEEKNIEKIELIKNQLLKLSNK